MLNVPELRAYMGRRGISASRLAMEIGVSDVTVRNWLRRGDMPLRYAGYVARVLEIPPEKYQVVFFAQAEIREVR